VEPGTLVQPNNERTVPSGAVLEKATPDRAAFLLVKGVTAWKKEVVEEWPRGEGSLRVWEASEFCPRSAA